MTGFTVNLKGLALFVTLVLAMCVWSSPWLLVFALAPFVIIATSPPLLLLVAVMLVVLFANGDRRS